MPAGSTFFFIMQNEMTLERVIESSVTMKKNMLEERCLTVKADAENKETQK
jgi:hypothetical protein